MTYILSIDWRPNNRRAKSLANDLSANLFLAPNIMRKKIYAPIRYIFLVFWTIMIVLKNRPKIIIASTPPPFCPLIILFYTMFCNCKYIVDASHLATMGFWSKIPFSFWVNKKVMNSGVITLVHNECIKKITDEQGIRSIVLETKIPHLRKKKGELILDKFSVIVPSSFDSDEPFQEIYKAASDMPEINFYVTGDFKRMKKKLLKRCPRNVIMTGFISENDFDILLNNVNAVLVLSTDDYPVRPRGVSEAIAAQKPIVVSLNKATQNHL